MQAFLSPGIGLLGRFGFARKFQLLFLLFILPLNASFEAPVNRSSITHRLFRSLQGVVPSLEIYTADIRKTLLEDTLGVKVEFLADNVTNLSNATSGA